MASGVVVPWETCAEPDCRGARIAPGQACLVHLSPEALAATLASGGGDVDLDGRGVRFTRESLERVLTAVPPDEAGHRLLGTVRFDRATFDHGALFDEVRVSGEVSMVGTAFKADARFGGAVFGGPADFSEASFGGQAWFVGAAFGGPATFRAATFQGPAWFQQTSFVGPASFDGASFSANATLSSVRFDDVASFAGASFDRRARFDRSLSVGGWRFEGARFRLEPEGLPAGTFEPPGTKVAPPVSAVVEGRSPTARARTKRKRLRFTGPLQLLVALAAVAVIAYIVVRPEEKPSSEFKDYAFLLAHPKTGIPARWNPCEPIRYVVNPEGSPPGGLEDLQQAIAEVSSASGLRFQNEGSTTERVTLNIPKPPSLFPEEPSSSSSTTSTTILGAPEDPKVYAAKYQSVFNRPAYQPDRYGKDRWAPVLLGWSSFLEVPEEVRGVRGIGAGDPRQVGEGHSTYVSGVAMINLSASLKDAKAIMMHELGHVVGLAHVESSDEAMFGSGTRQDSWGPGDLEGLRLVGAQAGCLPTPPPGP